MVCRRECPIHNLEKCVQIKTIEVQIQNQIPYLIYIPHVLHFIQNFMTKNLNLQFMYRCTLTAHHEKCCCLTLLQNKHFLQITYKVTNHHTCISKSCMWRCKPCSTLPLQQKTAQHFYSQCGEIYCVPEGDGTEHSAATNHALTAANNKERYFMISQ